MRNPVLLLSFLASTLAETVGDQEHMSRCLPAVRKFVTDGSDSVEWLFEKASDDADVVILYLARMCFFYHERLANEKYDMAPVFKAVTGKVESFGQHEFDLLSEAVRLEIVRGQHFEEYLESVSAEAPEAGMDMILVQVCAAVLGLGIPLYMWRRKQVVVINRLKED